MSSEIRDVHKGCFKFSKCTKCEHCKDLIVMNIKKTEERENLEKELKNTTITKFNVVIYTMHGAHHKPKVNPHMVLEVINVCWWQQKPLQDFFRYL